MTYPTLTLAGWRVWTLPDGLLVAARCHAPRSAFLPGIPECLSAYA